MSQTPTMTSDRIATTSVSMRAGMSVTVSGRGVNDAAGSDVDEMTGRNDITVS